ncbi:hypothetical protein GGX14DRAFT_402619 [Mycena pura]|uniref:Transmembrane protein n=1 Tax=Mycena pura TaxID=153505 RepID=A0AAD6UXE9_9AGAR|nr:hypothetical protein GGX14DRAFT_402619 [Mycena pura]
MSCTACSSYGQLAFSKGVFKFFTGGDLNVGMIHGSWSFTQCPTVTAFRPILLLKLQIRFKTLPELRRHAARSRTAVIAGSVSVSVGLLAAGVILCCMRRRRHWQQINQHRLPEQFTNAAEHVSQENLRLVESRLGQLADTENDPINAEDGEETVAFRLRRVEAQLETLLTMGIPEGSPPRYAG